eukprot:snap_masked-scaffold_33-processed-gene-3.26-mRNA-1 protein AED:1.00 eAED:1.00 QI:0/-1/0/0/-1/1/1/0/70
MKERIKITLNEASATYSAIKLHNSDRDGCATHLKHYITHGLRKDQLVSRNIITATPVTMKQMNDQIKWLF